MTPRGVPRGTLRAIAAVVVGTGSVLLWAELVHARARTRRLGPTPRVRSGPGAVVVLGFANRGMRANVVNRWRARMAVRSAGTSDAVTIITSGGPVRGEAPEASVLAQYLRDELGWTGSLLQETESRSTWDNVRNIIPMIESAEWIVFASNGLHAEKAREYLRRQRPDLADRLVIGGEYRFGEMILLKPLFAVVGLRKLRHLR
ncbi:uncharacterized SAM-binding protein YcdF (DUF218 family) [Curtobacterium sp. ZW137]|nr:uncharacterized SAM-binding protein YcdF (DUF218 family) [Curtobacterium sp. ZW137]